MRDKNKGNSICPENFRGAASPPRTDMGLVSTMPGWRQNFKEDF